VITDAITYGYFSGIGRCRVGRGVAAGADAPVAAAGQQPTTDEALAALVAGANPPLRPAEPSTQSVGYLSRPPFEVPADAVVINTPGTDDTTLYKRIDPMRGDLRTLNVVYPESLFPIISGKSGRLLPIFAPTYDQSTGIAFAHILEIAAALEDVSDTREVVYSGYSQGADALGDAATRLVADGLLDPATDQILLMSDPARAVGASCNSPPFALWWAWCSSWSVRTRTLPATRPIRRAAGHLGDRRGGPGRQLPMGLVPTGDLDGGQSCRLPGHPRAAGWSELRRSGRDRRCADVVQPERPNRLPHL
jgi:hypothetical protein